MLDAGADVSTIAAIVGHASVATTARYDRRGERAKEAAAGFISVPYKGRLT
jgi:site-specific recombinase XerD